MQTSSKIAIILLLILSAVFLFSCKNPTSQPYANILPITRLANVPPDTVRFDSSYTPPKPILDTVKIPRLTLSWVGDDPDGYVIGYKYRWSYTVGGPSHVYWHQWARLINITSIANLALMVDSTITDDRLMYPVYHYFATLPPKGLDTTLQTKLVNGDTIIIAGVKVFASNPIGRTYPVHVNPTSGTFIFDSEDAINPHTFEVAAIDDHGAASNPPASLHFFSPQVPPPVTKMITQPVPSDTIYVLDRLKLSDTWRGIVFSYTKFDPNTRTTTYSFAVDTSGDRSADSLRWSPWVPDTFTLVNASQFIDPFASRHTFSVRAKNEFGSIDTLGYYTAPGTPPPPGKIDTIRAKSVFYTIFPEFRMDQYHDTILVLNCSYRWDSSNVSVVSPIRPSQASMEAYYRSLMDSFHIPYVFHNYSDGFPSRAYLSHFRVLLIAADAISDTFASGFNKGAYDNHAIFDNVTQKILYDYCAVGGNIVFSSWNLYTVLNTSDPQSGYLFPHILHEQLDLTVQSIIVPNPQLGTPFFEFIGANGQGGYPDITLDPTKLDTSWHGALNKITAYKPTGFGEKIYTFVSVSDPNSPYTGTNIGVRYQGVSFNSIALGFPLYYVPAATARLVLKQAFHDCKVEGF
ncbi:MAG: hypothetical protein ACHQQQ_15295 [Bacteroidota bacterium]